MSAQSLPDSLLNAMTWRCIGPPRGGRVVAVAGDPRDPAVAYFGAVAGGVWKTTDAGMTWRNVSDGFFKTASVGALAVADSDPSVVYAGMGETTIRTDVSHGDGVYKSTDSGRTWTHCGLADTRHIGKVRVHPHNPDLVYVAALGHAFGPNEARGVFRSKDGGASWENVLFKSDKAGAVDLTFDPHTPAVLYASIWQAYRNFWELSSGGPDSGLWKSTDSGDTWTEITQQPGFATGLIGKIGVAASPARAGRVWAIVEAKEQPGLYRSDDFGETWTLINEEASLRQRPWYYCHIYADPRDADTVYILNLAMWKSTDGGKTFVEVGTPHGDNHDLWIDPHNSRRLVQGNDGGACVSFDGGASFSTIYNQLTAQFYHIAVDDHFPYRVYGTQQDNSSICVPSDTLTGAITWAHCEVAGTGESGYITVDPKDPAIVYVGAVGSSPGGLGALQRYDRRTGQIQLVNVYPEATGGVGVNAFKYRFPWTFPILFSPHDPQTLYTCANVAFRSSDDGHSWTPFSPDLTRNDVTKMEASGGPITLDTSGAEHYGTISTFRESPHAAGVFWAGSDDGLVHLSRDGGQTWHNVTPPDLPEWSLVRTVEPSPHDPATLYLAATRYKLDDPAPYLYKTADYGATWHKIVDGIPAGDFTRVIRADPNRPGVLYAGTETGLYLSVDDGASWQRWQGNLPVTPIYDLLVKGADLVLGTHGRAFWLLDDLTPLYQAMDGAAREAAQPALFAPRPALRFVPDLVADWNVSEGRGYGMGISAVVNFTAKKTETGQVQRTFLDAGTGAPHGALLYYHLPEGFDPATAVKLDVVDAGGAVVATVTPKPAGYDKWDDKQKSLDTGPWLPVKPGINRFVWNLRHSGAVRVPGNKTAGESLHGPLVLPGVYELRLTVGDQALSRPLEVVNDPRVQTSPEDLAAQHALLIRIRDKISDAHRGVNRLRDLRDQIQGWRKRLAGQTEVVATMDAVLAKLDAVEDALILPGDQKNTYALLQRTRLNGALASLISIVASADSKPTASALELTDHYGAQIDAQLAQLQAVVDDDVAALNAAIQALNMPPVTVDQPASVPA
jgi:photosystem II stability/assembly factor-like uncharacterized protein